jgi:TusA-related sulfurtransferase
MTKKKIFKAKVSERIDVEIDPGMSIHQMNSFLMHKMNNEVLADQLKAKDKIVEGIVREHALPKIKGPITKGKLKWRGISLGIHKNGLWCVMQRGKKIGPEYKGLSIVVKI